MTDYNNKKNNKRFSLFIPVDDPTYKNANKLVVEIVRATDNKVLEAPIVIDFKAYFFDKLSSIFNKKAEEKVDKLIWDFNYQGEQEKGFLAEITKEVIDKMLARKIDFYGYGLACFDFDWEGDLEEVLRLNIYYDDGKLPMRQISFTDNVKLFKK